MCFIVDQWLTASLRHKSHHAQGCVRRFKPERTLYLAFGHDEEVGGGHGARAVADLLRRRGVQLAFVLDEGGPLLVDGLQPFIRDKAVALVGTAEKARFALALTENLKSANSEICFIRQEMVQGRLSQSYACQQ